MTGPPAPLYFYAFSAYLDPAQRTDRVVRLADGRMATQGRFETRELLAIDQRGMVQIPRELLIEAGIDDEVTVRLVDEGILLEPTGDNDGD